MKNTLTYRGYTAHIEFDPKDKLFIGRVLGLASDNITFHGATVVELESDFHAAIEHYVADCKATGRKPQKTYSGKLMLRIPSEVHARVAMKAKAHGKSINEWATEVLVEAS